jgi:hypothetical protein
MLETTLWKVSSMSNTSALNLKNPATRYYGGFDRWSVSSLSGRTLITPWLGLQTHEEDDQGRIWWWSSDDEIWWLLADEHIPLVRRWNQEFVFSAARAAPIIRLLVRTDVEGEFWAAFHALTRLAQAIAKAWEKPSSLDAYSLYVWATREVAWQMREYEFPPYDGAVAQRLQVMGIATKSGRAFAAVSAELEAGEAGMAAACGMDVEAYRKMCYG